MEPERTTVAIQRYLNDLGGAKGDAPVDPVVRDLLERAAGRLHLLCATLLHRSYARLTRPPLNLQSEEMLSAVVERLLRALRSTRPGNVRQFFALANQHMRWELNDLARRLDGQTPPIPLQEGLVPAPEPPDSEIHPMLGSLLDAIDRLPVDVREALDLIRIQGMTQVEAAAVLEVSEKTVQRRVNRAMVLLTESLDGLQPPS